MSGFIEEVMVVASHRGSCSFSTRPGFRAAGGKWKGFRLLHLDFCWRVILDATHSSISLSMLVCSNFADHFFFPFLPRVRDGFLGFLSFFSKVLGRSWDGL